MSRRLWSAWERERRPVAQAAQPAPRDRRGWDRPVPGWDRPGRRTSRFPLLPRRHWHLGAAQHGGKAQARATYCRSEHWRTQSHAESVGNAAVTFCQRDNCGLVQSAKYVTLFRMTELSESSAGQTADALPLGAQSLVWRYFGDNRMFLIGPRPAVLQNMLAELGQGVLDHSVFFSDTSARIKRSLPPIFKTVYGSTADNTGEQVRDFHHQIKGEMPSGERYHALDPDTYFWAHATFVEQVLYFADTFVKRLTDAEKQQIYLESKPWYRRYGVSERPMPADYDEFERYWDHMMERVMVAHPTAKYGVGYVTKGFPRPKGVSPLAWRVVAPVFNPVAAFLTTGGMPPRGRELLGLPWGDRQERRYQRFAALWRSRPVNWLWDHLPMRLRYNGFACAGYARR